MGRSATAATRSCARGDESLYISAVRKIRLQLATGLLLVAGVLASGPASASAAPFGRGDVFLTGSGSVQEFSPTGQLIQTIPESSGAGPLCFDPDGTRLILPGVGLFDNDGNELPSRWASVPAAGGAGQCVVDGSGDVYVTGQQTTPTPGQPGSVSWHVLKYDLDGKVMQTFLVTSPASVDYPGFMIALAPDECTMFTTGYWLGVVRLNTCTNTQETLGGPSSWDDLVVLPNWQILAIDDCAAITFGASFGPPSSVLWVANPVCASLRTISLDPDNTSFWASSGIDEVYRVDITTGQQLSEWPGAGPLAVYGPPLLGDANVNRTVDSDTPGTAEAFPTRAGFTGQLSRLHLYVDSSNTASQIVVGLYADHDGNPGALVEQGTISDVMPGSWNYVDIPAVSVTAGQRYWIAVLGPYRGGTIGFRDQAEGDPSHTSAQTKLTSLPAYWSTGATWASKSLSAYGS